MKKIAYILIALMLSTSVKAQDTVNYVGPIFTVTYSQKLEQPIRLSYTVLCPFGEADRAGMDFYEPKSIHTSDGLDYLDNKWDKGHLAPAAAFSCSKDTLKMTFSYLNSALQHESLNRGPWAKLEMFERNLARVYDEVNVTVICHFSERSEVLPTGATVPDGFTKIIEWDDKQLRFYFPNQDVAGTDWYEFIVK